MRIASKYGVSIEYGFKIKGAASYYPMCQMQRIPTNSHVPLLVEIAGEDALDEPFVGCEESRTRNNGTLTLNVIAGAPHGFDKSEYQGLNVRKGTNKVGHKYLIEFGPISARESYVRLEEFIARYAKK